MAEQNIIIIGGMHRSGTSLSASLLEKSGLKIGENLMSNGFDNKKGHFEDLEILQIHEEDLRAKSLDTRGLSGEIESHLHFEQTTLVRIDELLKSKKKLQLWGWKEPRTTLYLDAWKKIIPNAKCIAVYRHYDEVADSLVRRYKHKLLKGISMSLMVRIKHFIIYPIHIFFIKREAYRCWYIYNKSILDFKYRYPDDILIIQLDHFTTNYNQILTLINKQFNIELSQIQVDKIVDQSLLTKTGNNNKRIRLFSVKKLNDLLTLLNKNSLWI